MADQGLTAAQTTAEGKGKSKAENPPQDVSMEEDDNSSDEETGAEEEVLAMCDLVFILTNKSTRTE
jgi:hypothetical protein